MKMVFPDRISSLISVEARSRETNRPSICMISDSCPSSSACSAVTGRAVMGVVAAKPTSLKTASVSIGALPSALANPAMSTISPLRNRVVWIVCAHIPRVASRMHTDEPGHCSVTCPRTCTRWASKGATSHCNNLSMGMTGSLNGSPGAGSKTSTAERLGH